MRGTIQFATAALSLLLVAAAGRTLAGEKAPSAPATQPSTQPAAANQAVNKFCPVQKDNPVDDRVPTYEYNGMQIGFCCPDCVNEFKLDPEKYVKDMK